jgi:antitoxin component HigA of HigAB toxin-antitoxin module
MVSGMESGKRSITTKMAKRIEQEYGISYKAFL